MSVMRIFRSPRLRGAVRVAGFLAFVNVALTALLLPQARADVEQELQRGGLALLEQLGPSLVGTPELAIINGQRVSLSSKTTELSVTEALNRVERHCRESSGGLAEGLRAMPETAAQLEKLPPALRDPSGWLLSRQDAPDGNLGQLTCFARKNGFGTVAGYLERVAAFASTGELSELGDARYAVARKDPKSGRTHLLAVWTEGGFNIRKLVPSEGDALGGDSTQVPRPPTSRRMLTAELANHAYAMRMYDTDQSHASVLAFYDRALPLRGFRSHALPRDADGRLDLNDHVRAFSKDGAAVIVVTRQTPEERTGVTLIEMGSLGFATATARAEGPFE